jgi:hypothetical protein
MTALRNVRSFSVDQQALLLANRGPRISYPGYVMLAGADVNVPS